MLNCNLESEAVLNKESFILSTLNSLYDLALKGAVGTESALQLANEFAAPQISKEEQIKRLIDSQSRKCSTAGFMSGFGGFLTLPIALPIDITANYYIQIRMVMAIAHIAGHDIQSGAVKAIVLACLLGNAAKDVLRDAGVRFSARSTGTAIEKLSRHLIPKINKSLGRRFLARSGKSTLLHANKLVPFVGGIVGASIDYFSCQTVGRVARYVFFSSISAK